MMRVLLGIFPLLGVPVIIYNLMALTFGGGPDGSMTMAENISRPFATIGMVAPGAVWTISPGDLLVIVSVGFFFFEILKSTSTGASTIVNHAISMMLFIICLVEFLLLKNFSTSVFFILTLMALLDVLAGVVVTIISARRDFTVGDQNGGGR